MGTELVKPPLKPAEARTLADTIKKHYNSAKLSALEFVERQGWAALGYPNLDACVATEFDFSKSTFYRQLGLEQIKRDCGIAGQPIEVPAASLAPLKALPVAERAETWGKAVDRHGANDPPASVVKAVIAEKLAAKPAPSPHLSAPIIETVTREPGDDEGEEDQAQGPDDTLWVKTLPAYGHLEGHQREVFIADALAWRHLRKHTDTFRIFASRETTPAKKRVSCVPPWIGRLGYIFAWRGPYEWPACKDCMVDGTSRGVVTVIGKPERCGTCHGHGYCIK